jgi:hypothetical protein
MELESFLLPPVEYRFNDVGREQGQAQVGRRMTG